MAIIDLTKCINIDALLVNLVSNHMQFVDNEAKSSESAAIRWCFTINNYTEEEESGLQAIIDECKALCVGREVGEQGTPHLQGYVEFRRRLRRRQIGQLYSCFSRAALFIAKGSREQNRIYCSKGGDVLVDVGAPAFSNRTDLAGLRDLMDSKDNPRLGLLSVAEQDFGSFLKYGRNLREYALLKDGPGPLRLELKVSVFYGRPGSGKTKRVYEECGDELYWWTGERWFDGYHGQSIVLLDDYTGQLGFAFLLRLLDIYPLQVAIKGGFVWWKPTKIYITSNLRPEEWYGGVEPDRMQALLRRLHLIEEIN